MNGILVSVGAFLIAIGVLVTIHEFGHYWVARRLGVKVLRFSIGFGKPLWMKRFGKDGTELSLATIPLGGYVKMLDEHEGEVAKEELHRAFNRQPLSTRFAIVAAGPIFNFLFAILAYWTMYMSGVPGIRPLVGEVEPSSYAMQAGFRPGDEINSVGGENTPTWESAAMSLLDVALGQGQAEVVVTDEQGAERRLWIDFSSAQDILEKGSVLSNAGLTPWRPSVPAIIERLVKNGAGERAGLQANDRIISSDGTAIEDWNHWVDYVRERPETTISLEVERDGRRILLQLTPDQVMDDGKAVGRIGAYVRRPDNSDNDMRVVVRYGAFEAIGAALSKTWEITSLTLRTLWKMLLGQASIENLSGPISIAQYAGYSATIGLATFLGFLAVVSVSLGVLNLLPIPILDGGHLLYYGIELFKGSPLSEAAQLAGQRIGIAMLVGLMMLAFYNDLARLLG